MTALELSLFKDIPQRDKNLIYGYIREMQTILPKDTAFYNIPQSINYICALFYYLRDKWDEEYIGPCHALSNGGYCITTQVDESSSYGTILAKSPGIYRWKFKIHEIFKTQYKVYWALVLGVWKTKSMKNPKTDFHYANSTENTGIYSWGYAYDFVSGTLIDETGIYANGPKYGSRCNEGDIIEIIIDLEVFTLRYAINDQDQGIAFNDVEDTEYRVAFSSEREGFKIEMLQ